MVLEPECCRLQSYPEPEEEERKESRLINEDWGWDGNGDGDVFAMRKSKGEKIRIKNNDNNNKVRSGQIKVPGMFTELDTTSGPACECTFDDGSKITSHRFPREMRMYLRLQCIASLAVSTSSALLISISV